MSLEAGKGHNVSLSCFVCLKAISNKGNPSLMNGVTRFVVNLRITFFMTERDTLCPC